jgi:DNA-binding transcriptional regulator GbsR (MarR family)
MGRVKYRFNIRGKEYFPIPFEQRLRTLAEVTFAAVIQINERVYAVVESSVTRKKSRGLTATIHQLLSEIMPVEVIITKKMPRDLRHISKIDYEKVKKIIEKYNSTANA